MCGTAPMKGLVLVFMLLCAVASYAQQDNHTRICGLAYMDLSQNSNLSAQVVDYSGKAIDDMGNYDGCQELPSIVQYCVAQTEVGIKNNEHVTFYMGVCAPSNCTAEDLRVIMSDSLNNTYHKDFPNSTITINEELNTLQVHCIARGWHKITPGAIITIVVFSLIALVVVIGTLLEYVDAQIALRDARMNTLHANREQRPLIVDDLGSSTGEPDTLRLTVETSLNSEFVPVKRRDGKLKQFFKCFAIGSNLEFLMKDNRSGEPGLSALNGLRCLMMFWIILGHTFGYLNTPVGFDNSIDVTKHVISRVSFQVVSGAELAVDVFFYLSGFLVVYMTLKEMRNNKRPIPWGLFYFHRYWRLTPVYGLIILFYTTLTPFMIYGPFSYLYRGMKTDLCDKYWWTNILYINNFYPTNSNNQCLGWGWYLANDMQFFVLSPLIILLYKKNRRAAYFALSFLFVGCIMLIGILTYKNHLRPLDPGDANWNTIVYNKPYTRVAPYLVGIGFAFLVQHDEIDLLKHWPVRWTVYLASATATTCSTYLTYGFWRDDGWVMWQNVLYATSARTLFTLGTAWFMYACYKGHGGILRSILSVYMWVPIARLTYTAYLLHPIVMFVINFSATTNFHYSAIYSAVRYSSHILLAYVCGLVFHLAIEKPTANMERLMLPRKH